jgi:catechol-2,3-dioxygenase
VSLLKSDTCPGISQATNWRFPMAKQTKGRIRHVALSVQNPWETAEFYKEALGLEEVTELDGALAEGVFLTDGTSILPY